MIRRPPRSTRTDTLFPYTTLFRSKPVVVKDGRFGPYVTDGETNASLRKGDTIENVTIERAAELLQIRRDAGPAKKGGRKKAAAKKAPAKKTAKKATKKAGAAKKAAGVKKAAPSKATAAPQAAEPDTRSEEHTSELQSLMRIPKAVICSEKNT